MYHQEHFENEQESMGNAVPVTYMTRFKDMVVGDVLVNRFPGLIQQLAVPFLSTSEDILAWWPEARGFQQVDDDEQTARR